MHLYDYLKIHFSVYFSVVVIVVWMLRKIGWNFNFKRTEKCANNKNSTHTKTKKKMVCRSRDGDVKHINE